MNLPVLIINFKTYAESRGKRGLALAQQAAEVAKEYNVEIVAVPQVPDMISIASQVEIPVFSQHLDPNPPGSATGHIQADTLKEGGITGTLLNHSERRLESSVLEDAIKQAKSAGLYTVVCAGSIGLSGALSMFTPWAVAMEPPELIGGDVSVTTKPQLVQDAVAAIRKGSPEVIALTGAGVKTAEHVKVALELGTKGILLASGVVKAKDPKSVLAEMAKAMVE